MRPSTALAVSVVILAMSGGASGQGPDRQAGAAAIVRSDAEFARSVAEKNKETFQSFLAEATTFNGGTRNELHGRDAVLKDWAPFFEANGPTLTWTPMKGEVIGAGDVGYTIGRSLFRQKASNGSTIERGGQYLTVWRKQPDGSWKVVFDTGSTLSQ